MDYVGLDPAVGLECSHCNHISRMPYSNLLALVVRSQQAKCDSCQRLMLHDWTTVAVVQNIIKKRMEQANEMKSRRASQLSSVN
ncbi:MAG: hypothetical protein PVH91_01805 [Pseudomonadales bacterium]|jgi:hypothetical protein